MTAALAGFLVPFAWNTVSVLSPSGGLWLTARLLRLVIKQYKDRSTLCVCVCVIYAYVHICVDVCIWVIVAHMCVSGFEENVGSRN